MNPVFRGLNSLKHVLAGRLIDKANVNKVLFGSSTVLYLSTKNISAL